jgi:hypothetical protein
MKYFNVPEYYYRGQYPQPPFNFEQEPKPKGESIFNLINDKESLNRINKIANQGVNHIVAAFYIKSVQQNKAKTSEMSNVGRRVSAASVPINSVPLDDKEESEENLPKSSDSNTNVTKSNEQINEMKEQGTKDKETTTVNEAILNDKDINKNNFNDNNLVKIIQNAGNELNQGDIANTTENKETKSNNGDSISSKIFAKSNDKDLKTANFSINNNNINKNHNNISVPFHIIDKNFNNNQDKDLNKQATNIHGTNTNTQNNFHSFGNSSQFAQASRFINNSSRPQSQIYNEQKPNSSFMKSSFTEDLNQFTAQQLNTVSNMVKRIKENKLSELIEKDNHNSSYPLKK